MSGEPASWGADLHVHFLLYAHHLRQPFSRPGGNVAIGPLGDRVSLERALAGGVRCITFAVYVPGGRWRGIPAVLDQIDTFERVAAASGGRLVPARTGADVRRIAASGGVAGVLSVEGGHGLDGDPDALRRLSGRGVRSITLTHLVVKALAQALHSRGMDVLCERHGFTESHTLVVDVEEFRGGAKVAKALESANIIVNKNLLPWDSDPVRPSGIRLGSQEVTRLGMKEKDMDSVAELIARVAKGEDPSRVKDDATRLKSGFTKVHYCFFEGEEAYDYPSYDGDL